MARTVRVVGEVRRAAPADETGLNPQRGTDGRERARMYALPAERGVRAEAGQPWEQLAGEYRQLVVLADPGMGKSWLIRAETHRLAMAAAAILTDASAGVEDVLIPVPVRADVLATALGWDLAEVIIGYLVKERLLDKRSAAPMRDRIAAGGVVLLVDALDEVPREAPAAGGQAPAKRLQNLLRQWAADCPGARCVLTSRLAGYGGSPLPGAQEAELLPFTPQDTRAAMQAWDLPARAVSRIDRLLGDPAVAGMARVPLLLALICWLAADSKDDDALPNTRAGLYEAVLWHFLSGSHRADHQSPAAMLTPPEREGLLRILARVAFSFATTRQGWVDRMPYTQLAAAIGGAGAGIPEPGAPSAEDLIRRCEQAGVLVPAGNPSIGGQPYMFLHRTIAEYLTARHLADLPPAQRMQTVADHQWFEPDWTEVIPLLGVLLATDEPAGATALLTHFLSQWPDPLHRAFGTAIRILGEQPDPDYLLDPSHARQLYKRAVSLLKQELTRERLLTTTPTWPRPLFDALLSLLHDSDNWVRSAAAHALKGRQDPAVTQALLPLLRDTSDGVRINAVNALADRPDPAVTQALIPLLRDSHDWVRSAAFRGLEGRPDPAVTQALIRLLHDTDADSDTDLHVRSAAFGALPRCLASVTTQALISMLHDTDIYVRSAAGDALERRPDPATAQALLPLLRDGDNDVRFAAARALAGHPDPAVTQALLPLLRDGDNDVRSAAAHALAGRPDPAVTQALLPLLRDNDSPAQAAAAHALAGRPDQAVTQALLSLLHDADADVGIIPASWVRAAAVRALADRPDLAVTQALLPLLRDSDSDVRLAAVNALEGRPDPAVTQAFIRLLHDTDAAADAGIIAARWVREAVVRALADRPDPAVTQALVSQLCDSDSDVRDAAVSALKDRLDLDVTQTLFPLLRDNDSRVRSAAVSAVAGRLDPAVTQALLPLLRDSDSHVRSAAVSAVAGRPDPAVTQALLPLLRDSDSHVQWVAILALGRRPDQAVTQALLPLLHGSESHVRTQAVRTLADRPDQAVTQALLPLLRDSDVEVRGSARRALTGRSEPQLLAWVAKQGMMPQDVVQRMFLYQFADQIADRDYLRLPPDERSQIRRRLSKLTRKAAPVPGQQRLTAVGRLQAITRGARSQPRWRPLRAAAAFAVAAVAGVVGGKLTGKLTPALVVFAVLLVAGVILTYRAERGADTAHTRDANQHPR